MPVRAAQPHSPHWRTPMKPNDLQLTHWVTGAARREDESLGHPRNPQGHRASRHHQLRRRPALAQDLSGRARSRRPARRCCGKTARPRCNTPPAKATARCARWSPPCCPGRWIPAQVLITTGSQQGLDLVAKILIDAGTRILVETPTYLGALAGLLADGARGRERGERRRRRGRRRPRRTRRSAARFLYLLPNFQNPTGRTMTEQRRAALVASRRRTGPAHRRGQPLRRPVVRRRRRRCP